MHDDIQKYRSIITEMDITRRGFLKGIASIAASTALPTGVVASAVKNISIPELSMLEKLLKLGDIYELQNLVRTFSSGIDTDAFTEEDWDSINNALPPGTDFWEWEGEQNDNGLDVVSAVEKLIGRKTLKSLAGDLAEEYDINLEDLMDLEEVLDVLGFQSRSLVRNAGEEAEAGEEAAAGEEATAGLEAGAGEEATVGIANTARLGALTRQLTNKLRKSDDDYNDDYDDDDGDDYDDDDGDDYDDDDGDDKTTSNIDEMRKYKSIIAEAYKGKI